MGKLVKTSTSVQNFQKLKSDAIKLVKDRITEEYQQDYLKTLNEIEVGAMFYAGTSISSRTIVLVDKIVRKKKCLFVEYREWNFIEQAWSKEGKCDDILEFLRDIYLPKLSKHPLEIYKEAQEAIESRDLSKFEFDTKESEVVNGPGTSVLSFQSKENLISLQNELEVRKNHIEVVKRMMEIIIEEKKEQLYALTRQMHESIELFKKKISKVFRAVTTLELYLGIQETIIQIQEGPTASATEPISIRQGLMYMDEEVGDPWDDGQGIEWKHVKDFDKWLTRNDNYKKVLPEVKGIAAFQCRRKHKDKNYSNPFVQMQMEDQDNMTFLLMRNGDNLYRIITDKINFRPRMFPKREELQSLFELFVLAAKAEEEGKNHIWSHERESEKIEKLNKKVGMRIPDSYPDLKEKADDRTFEYKMRFALLQGIIERTQIFHPLAESIKFFDNDTFERGLVRLIYDDERTLPSHKKSFWDWLKEGNSKITFGSRIVLAHNYQFTNKFNSYHKWCELNHVNRLDDRFKIKESSRFNLPHLPQSNLYYIEEAQKFVSKPVWVPNPRFKENLPVTEDTEKNNGKGKLEIFMSYKDQKKYFGKVIKKSPFHDNSGAYIEVKRNPKNIHKSHIEDTSTGKRERFEYANVVEKYMVIRYNPKDKISRKGWEWVEPYERKHRIQWSINNDDEFILNYDVLTKDDIEFYLSSRVDRRDYIDMMPVLMEVLKVMEREEKEERDFKKLVKGEVLKTTGKMPTDSALEAAVLNWKTNLKWKRAIKHDDEKALRMIVKKLTKKYLEKV